MIKAIRVHETGGADVMRVESIDLPPPGPGEVRVRNRAIGLNFIDTYFRSGLYKTALPFTPGNEGAGEVVAIGEGVKHIKDGERVAYISTLGAYAEEANVPAKSLMHLPKSITFETGAAMTLKGLTAQYLLRQTFRVKKGHTILIHAAAGGVGQIVCQWAALLGAEIIATVGSDEKAEIASKAGADHTIVYTREDFVERVRTITKGKMCDVVYDGIGKATFPASLDCLKPLGTFVSFGSASGPIDAFDIGLLSKGSLFATRPTLFTYIDKAKDFRKMADELTTLVGKEKIDIPIHASFPLDEAVEAHRALEERRTTGATVLIP